MELKEKEIKLIDFCMSRDIIDIEGELDLIKHTLDSIKKGKILTQNDFYRIKKSLNYDISARMGTKSEDELDTRLMIELFDKLNLFMKSAPKNFISEEMINGRIK